MQKIDLHFLVDYEGDWIDFVGRSETGYDVTITDKIVIREIFKENVYQVFESDIDDTKTVIDLGGNIGAFSIYMAFMGAEKIVTYEPDTFNFDVLTQNIQANNLEHVITACKQGVLDNPGKVEIYNGQGGTFVQGLKVLNNAAQEFVMNNKPTVETVDVVSLEQVYKDNGVVYADILKVDVEGSEYKIFEAASPDYINKARYITMEFHAASAETFGKLIAKLSLTHNTHIIGRHDTGGQIYAKRY